MAGGHAAVQKPPFIHRDDSPRLIFGNLRKKSAGWGLEGKGETHAMQ